jgi:hypothetical protein
VPLLLLRSDQSIELGAKWFAHYWEDELEHDRFETHKLLIGRLVGWAAATFVAIVLARNPISFEETMPAFFYGMAVGYVCLQFGLAGTIAAKSGALPSATVTGFVAVIIAAGVVGARPGGIAAGEGAMAILAALAFAATQMVREKKIRGTIFFGATASGFALGIWSRSVAIRVIATARYATVGFWDIPKNFFHNLFLVDFSYPAELMPGYRRFPDFTSDGLIKAIRENPYIRLRWFRIFLFPIFFIPAYAYRLSIKSTCWLYFPMVYIVGIRSLTLSPAHFINKLERAPKERLRRVLASITIFGFIVTTFVYNIRSELASVFDLKIISPVEYLFLVDFHRVKVWQLFSLLSALITIYLFISAGEIRIDNFHALDAQSHESVKQRVNRLRLWVRARNVSSAILILILGTHVLLLFSPVANHLPTFILDSLRWAYGEYMPSSS